MRPPEQLAEHLERDANAGREARMWQAIDARRGRRPRRARRLLPMALAAVAVGLAAIVLTWPREPVPTALVGADGKALDGALRPGVHALSDASRIVVADGARLDVLDSSPRELELALRSGRARFEVTPGGPRRWAVACGDVRGEVVGTVFEVDRQGELV
ncbi:MAG: FecR family protein, partial [Myxococcota bacterium]